MVAMAMRKSKHDDTSDATVGKPYQQEYERGGGYGYDGTSDGGGYDDDSCG